jgi:predicted PhzF superfamily epimerase YddE/YHI9
MEIYQVDAFAKEIFQGNPAAVIPLKEWLPDELLQRIAMENNLSETAYFVPMGGGFSIRWFTPTVEVALCGHATLASGHVLVEHLGYSGDTILFHTQMSGDLTVSREPAGGGTGSGARGMASAGTGSGVRAGAGEGARPLTLNFPVDDPQPADPSSMGVLFEGLRIPPRELYMGTTDYMIVLDSQQAIMDLQPDFKRLAGASGRGVLVTARGEEADFVSRCFFPQSGIDEDPATGSAHTMLIPYWAKELGKTTLSAIQLSTRRGHLDCKLAGDRVLISGYAKTFMRGEVLL